MKKIEDMTRDEYDAARDGIRLEMLTNAPRDLIASADARPEMMAPPFPDYLGYFIADAAIAALAAGGYVIVSQRDYDPSK